MLDQLGAVRIQQLKQPLVNDPWEVAVFQESKTVKFLLLDGSRGQTTQSQVLVQIGKVRMQKLRQETPINLVVIFLKLEHGVLGLNRDTALASLV